MSDHEQHIRSYWTGTDDIRRALGGNPRCSSCGREMFPQDDHGRFRCGCRQDHESLMDQAVARAWESVKKDREKAAAKKKAKKTKKKAP